MNRFLRHDERNGGVIIIIVIALTERQWVVGIMKHGQRTQLLQHKVRSWSVGCKEITHWWKKEFA